jgi:hypothetical protein
MSVSIRPLLADVALGQFIRRGRMGEREYEEDLADIEVGLYDDELEIEVPLWNVGAGIALLEGPKLILDAGELSWRSVTLQTAVPSGELTRLDFRGSWPDAASAQEHWGRLDQNESEFSVEIAYTDLTGDQRTRTRAVVKHRV